MFEVSNLSLINESFAFKNAADIILLPKTVSETYVTSHNDCHTTFCTG